jgi:hypothetical protein
MAPDSPVATRIWLGARLIAMMKLATVARLREGDSNPCPLQYNLVLLPLLEEPASHTPLACWTPRYYTEPAHASPPHLLRWAAQSEAVGHWASLCLSSTDSDITHQIARIQCELPYFMHGLDMSADLPGKLLVGICRCFLHARRSAHHQSPPHSRQHMAWRAGALAQLRITAIVSLRRATPSIVKGMQPGKSYLPFRALGSGHVEVCCPYWLVVTRLRGPSLTLLQRALREDDI